MTRILSARLFYCVCPGLDCVTGKITLENGDGMMKELSRQPWQLSWIQKGKGPRRLPALRSDGWKVCAGPAGRLLMR